MVSFTYTILRYLSPVQQRFIVGFVVTTIVYNYSLIPAWLNAIIWLGLLVRGLLAKDISVMKKAFCVVGAGVMTIIYVEPSSIDMAEGRLKPYTSAYPESPELLTSALRLRYKLQEAYAYRRAFWGGTFEERMEVRRDFFPFFEEDLQGEKARSPHSSQSDTQETHGKGKGSFVASKELIR